jgi:hypothetical protein
MMVGGHTRVGMARIFLAGAALLLATACIKISPMIPSWPKAAAPQGALTLAPDSGYIVAAQINGHPVRPARRSRLFGHRAQSRCGGADRARALDLGE